MKAVENRFKLLKYLETGGDHRQLGYKKYIMIQQTKNKRPTKRGKKVKINNINFFQNQRKKKQLSIKSILK